jgi:hypothetical protein
MSDGLPVDHSLGRLPTRPKQPGPSKREISRLQKSLPSHSAA